MNIADRIDLAVLDIHLFDLAGTSITLATLVVFVLIIVATVILSAVLQRALARALKFRGITHEGTLGAAKKLLHYALLALGLAVALQTIGIQLATLFAAGAVFAIGLGFAMQNIAQNFVSGIILLLERSIKPGDVLQVENRFVRVAKIGIRSTIAKTLDEEEIIVPNSVIVQGIVTNYTLRDSLYRLRCPVGVVYGSDMALVRQTLDRVGREVPWRNKTQEPVVLLTGFGSSSVDFEVSVWMDDPWRVKRARSELNEAIWWALKEAEITIAFPQLDVHFDPPVVQGLENLSRAS
jgi:small-conductance mechanosensitive channel